LISVDTHSLHAHTRFFLGLGGCWPGCSVSVGFGRPSHGYRPVIITSAKLAVSLLLRINATHWHAWMMLDIVVVAVAAVLTCSRLRPFVSPSAQQANSTVSPTMPPSTAKNTLFAVHAHQTPLVSLLSVTRARLSNQISSSTRCILRNACKPLSCFECTQL
jgi:hypothetical protein